MKIFRYAFVALFVTSGVVDGIFAQQKVEFLFAYRPSAYAVLEKYIGDVSIVAPEPFVVDASGVVYGEIEPKLLKLAREHNVKVMPQIKNLDSNLGLFSQEWVHGVLTNPQARRRTIAAMLELCKRNNLWGMQIDFENVHADDRDALTSFYREAAATLHQAGYKISIAVVHRTEEYGGPNTYTKWMMENWRGGYDLKALGEIGDFIKIMSYGQHTRRTTPGPSQGLPWLEEVVRHFLAYVPAEKLSLGITMSAAHYYTVADTARYYQNARSWSRGASLKEVESLIEQYGGFPLTWDDRQKVLFGYIERGGIYEWFFIDNDIRSFDAKLALVKKYNLRGINSWISGAEDPLMWEHIKAFQ